MSKTLTTTETKGSITLKKDPHGYGYAQTSEDSLFAISNRGGGQWGDNTWSHWTLAGAEVIDGINSSLWINDSNQQFWVAQYDSSWHYSSSGGEGYIYVSGSG